MAATTTTNAATTALIVGATGQQGGAVVSALLRGSDSSSQPSPPLHILALTRNPSSAKAVALAKNNPGTVSVVRGDITEPASIFKDRAKGSIERVFLVTLPNQGRGPGEDEMAVPFIDAAVEHGVRHIVFSSVDRGGEPRSWENPTEVKHFYEKHAIELHLRRLARRGEGTLTYTILRPVAFMENINPGTFCSLFISMWGQALGHETRLQLVSVRDIGIFAARALRDPAGESYRDKAIGLAGDELTLAEVKAAFKKAVGRSVPEAWGIVGRGMLWAIGEVRLMFAFFEREGYGVDVKALRREDPGLLDLEGWLRGESKWRVEGGGL